MPANPSAPKKQSKASSKPTPPPATAPPASSPPLKSPLVSQQTDHFLMVKVNRGASRADLIAAVEQALRAKDVPLFKDHKLTGAQDRIALNPNPCPPDTLGDKLGPDDAIMIMCKQEGWP